MHKTEVNPIRNKTWLARLIRKLAPVHKKRLFLFSISAKKSCNTVVTGGGAMTFGFPCWSTKSPGIKFGSSSVPGLNVDVGAVVVETFNGFTVVESAFGSSVFGFSVELFGFSVVASSGVGFSVAVVHVNLCKKLLFLHQLTHNMTADCSLNYKFNT